MNSGSQRIITSTQSQTLIDFLTGFSEILDRNIKSIMPMTKRSAVLEVVEKNKDFPDENQTILNQGLHNLGESLENMTILMKMLDHSRKELETKLQNTEIDLLKQIKKTECEIKLDEVENRLVNLV